MSKSILIIDTPKTCGDCPLCIFSADEKRHIGFCNTSNEDYYCKVLDRFMEYDRVDGGIDILGKPTDCPLKTESEVLGMSREELREHCLRQIQQFERIKEIMPVTPSGYKRYEEHKLVLELLEQEPCKDCISRESVRQLICKNNDRYGYSDRFHEFTEECLRLPSVTPQYTDVEIQKMQELEQAEIEKAYELGKAEQPKTGHCKDCKHWKDSDGTYRRDIYAESKCLMNCKEVYEGTGYCFLFESNEESEIEDANR